MIWAADDVLDELGLGEKLGLVGRSRFGVGLGDGKLL